MNKPMFLIGIAICVIAALFFLTLKELRTWQFPFLIMGIVLIGASRYRPMK